MNAIEQIRSSLGIKADTLELVEVVAVGNNVVEANGHNGKVLKLAGNWKIGTKLTVRSGVVESVVVKSGLIVFEN